MKRKIYVEVRGGVVDAVYTDQEGEQIQVVLVDWDNIEAGDAVPELPDDRIYLY